jgi:hypothetical protein
MKHIIKLFLVTFSLNCYIGNISRLTSGVKVTNEAIVVFNDIRAVSVIFNMLLQIVHTNP